MKKMNDLEHLRDKIEACDKKIAALLAKRFGLVQEIGHVKKRNNIPLLQKKREEALLKMILYPYNDQHLKIYLENIFKNIYLESKHIQQK